MVLQADIAADPVGFVHHGRADAQVGQLLEYFRRIALGTAPPALLPRAVAEQLRLGEDLERRRVEAQPRYGRRHGDAEVQVAGDEGRKVVEDLRLNAATAQQIEQQLAPPRGLGGEQHAAATCGKVCRELRGRLLGARIDANRGRRRTREILHRPRGFGRPFEGAQLQPAATRRTAREIPPGASTAPPDRGSAGGGRGATARAVRRCRCHRLSTRGAGLMHVDQNAARRQIFEQMRGAIEEQRQEELQPPGRLARRSHRDRPVARSDRRLKRSR